MLGSRSSNRTARTSASVTRPASRAQLHTCCLAFHCARPQPGKPRATHGACGPEALDSIRSSDREWSLSNALINPSMRLGHYAPGHYAPEPDPFGAIARRMKVLHVTSHTYRGAPQRTRGSRRHTATAARTSTSATATGACNWHRAHAGCRSPRCSSGVWHAVSVS